MNNPKIVASILILLCLLLFSEGIAQEYLNYELRLEPVWSRVADELGESGSIETVEFSPNGRFILSGSKYDNSLIMWRTSDGMEVWRQYTSAEIERAGWSYDGELVASVSEDYLVSIFEARGGELVNTFKHEVGLDGLIWAHHSKRLAIGEEYTEQEDGTSKGGNIVIYDLETNSREAEISYGRTVNELFFTKDDNYLLAAGHSGVKVYNTETWELVQDLQTPEMGGFTSASFSPNDQYIAGASNDGFPPGNIYIWDWQSGELIKRFNHLAKKVEVITWHPSGEYVLFTGHTPYIFVYRFNQIVEFDNKSLPVAHKVWASDHAEYLHFNKRGSHLVSAHQNGLIKLWVWMGEQSDLNSQLHQKILENQEKID